MGRLTTLGVKAITKPGLYPDGGGLYLQVTAGKVGPVAKSWLFRFKRAGKTCSQSQIRPAIFNV